MCVSGSFSAQATLRRSLSGAGVAAVGRRKDNDGVEGGAREGSEVGVGSSPTSVRHCSGLCAIVGGGGLALKWSFASPRMQCLVCGVSS